MKEFVFKVSSRKQLYDTFMELYPDVAKNCWGFEPFNWDNHRRSILIRMTENPLELGSRIMFEVSKDPTDGKWTQFRTLLIPYRSTDSEGRMCAG